jgi:hypothetical protein
MKMIVLAVVLAFAGCGSKKTAVDCDAEIAKGIEQYATTAKAHNASPRAQAMADAFKEALTERCKADKWTPEVVACFTKLTNVRDIQNCRNQLPADQQTRLDNELKEAIQSRMGAGMMGQRMPPMPGHPTTLTGSNGGSGAPGAAGSPSPGAAPSGEAAPAGSGAAAPAPAGSPPAPAAPSGAPAPSGGSAAK